MKQAAQTFAEEVAKKKITMGQDLTQRLEGLKAGATVLEQKKEEEKKEEEKEEEKKDEPAEKKQRVEWLWTSSVIAGLSCLFQTLKSFTHEACFVFSDCRFELSLFYLYQQSVLFGVCGDSQISDIDESFPKQSSLIRLAADVLSFDQCWDLAAGVSRTVVEFISYGGLCVHGGADAHKSKQSSGAYV